MGFGGGGGQCHHFFSSSSKKQPAQVAVGNEGKQWPGGMKAAIDWLLDTLRNIKHS